MIASIVMSRDGEPVGGRLTDLILAACEMYQDGRSSSSLKGSAGDWVTTRLAHRVWNGVPGIEFNAEVTVGDGKARLSFLVNEDVLKGEISVGDTLVTTAAVIPDRRQTRSSGGYEL